MPACAEVNQAMDNGRFMDGLTPVGYTFKRKNQAVTLGMTSYVRINGDHTQVDPWLLFQRLILLLG